MRSSTKLRPRSLGAAEQVVMDFVWSSHGPVSAEDCRRGLREIWPMKESTVRTVLLRLEQKGYLTHTVEGRAFKYLPSAGRLEVAARTVKHLIQRFCGGSAEELVLGLVDQKIITPAQLKALLKRIADEERRRQ
jgi:predicted transcriptional regulator